MDKANWNQGFFDGVNGVQPQLECIYYKAGYSEGISTRKQKLADSNTDVIELNEHENLEKFLVNRALKLCQKTGEWELS